MYPESYLVFLAAWLWPLTLDLNWAQTPLDWEVRRWLIKGERGGSRGEETRLVQDNWRKIGVCSHHWPASHSPPSAAHSLGWQPAPCRSCWPLSLPGWRGRGGEKQREMKKCNSALLVLSYLYCTVHVYLVYGPWNPSDIFDLYTLKPSLAAMDCPKWVIFVDEAIDQQQCCKPVKTGQLSVWCYLSHKVCRCVLCGECHQIQQSNVLLPAGRTPVMCLTRTDHLVPVVRCRPRAPSSLHHRLFIEQPCTLVLF